jgi:hypothetical protein
VGDGGKEGRKGKQSKEALSHGAGRHELAAPLLLLALN